MREYKKQSFELFKFFLISGLISILVYGWTCETIEDFIWTFFYGGVLFTTIWKANEFAVELSDKFFNWLEEPLKRFAINVFFMIVFTLIAYFSLDFIFNILLWGRPISKYASTVGLWEVITPVLVSFVINLFMYGRSFLFNWRQQAIDYEKLKTEHISTQFESLKNQLNPHFLFNSLNALSSLVYEDPDKSVEFIRKLSDVYRYVLEHREKEVVEFQEEVDFVYSFTFLQKIRFGDNLKIDFDFDSKNRFFIPPMALQLLIENAIKHNVVSTDHPLTISIRQIDEEYVEVSNNVKEKKHKDSTGIGLDNLLKRYSFLTKREVVIDNKNEYFTVKIPLLKFS